MDIIVDTREQKPLWKHPVAIRYKLLCGDYSTMLLRESFCIERKSLADLYGTLTKGHVRFRNELIRAQANGITLIIVVEGTLKQFINKQWPGGSRRLTSGEALGKIVNTVQNRYGVPVRWCGSRGGAKKLINQLLKERENEINKLQKRKSEKRAHAKNNRQPKQTT